MYKFIVQKALDIIVQYVQYRAMKTDIDIKSLRNRAGLSQEAMAEILGVTHATVSRWETGFSKPRPYIFPALQKLAKSRRVALSAPVDSSPSG